MYSKIKWQICFLKWLKAQLLVIRMKVISLKSTSMPTIFKRIQNWFCITGSVPNKIVRSISFIVLIGTVVIGTILLLQLSSPKLFGRGTRSYCYVHFAVTCRGDGNGRPRGQYDMLFDSVCHHHRSRILKPSCCHSTVRDCRFPTPRASHRSCETGGVEKMVCGLWGGRTSRFRFFDVWFSIRLFL